MNDQKRKRKKEAKIRTLKSRKPSSCDPIKLREAVAEIYLESLAEIEGLITHHIAKESNENK